MHYEITCKNEDCTFSNRKPTFFEAIKAMESHMFPSNHAVRCEMYKE